MALAACSTDSPTPDEYEATYQVTGVTGVISLDIVRPDAGLDSFGEVRASSGFSKTYTFPAEGRGLGAIIAHQYDTGTAILDILIDGTRRGRMVARADDAVTAQAWILQDGQLEKAVTSPF